LSYFVFCLSLVFLLSLYCTHCIGQQLVLYLALLSCSLCYRYVKLHVVHVLLFGANKEGRKEGRNHQRTRVETSSFFILFDENRIIAGLLLLKLYHNVTDHGPLDSLAQYLEVHGRTDRQTDRTMCINYRASLSRGDARRSTVPRRSTVHTNSYTLTISLSCIFNAPVAGPCYDNDRKTMQCVHIDPSSTNPIDLWFMSVIVVYHHNHCRR